MKTIFINSLELQYEITVVNEFAGKYHITTFYHGTKTVTYRKYWLLGKRLTKQVPIEIFSIWENIDDKKFSKSDVLEMIKAELIKFVKP